MQSDSTLSVSVAYALPERQVIVDLTLPEGTTVEQAVTRSGLAARFPELARDPLNCAIYGRAVPLDRRLEDGDRVEVLRSLLIDPKESRRQRAKRRGDRRTEAHE